MSATRRMATVLGLALAVLLGTSSLAQADGPEQVVQGRYLELVSVISEGAENLSPGDSMQWAVRISAPGLEEGTIARTLAVGGDLAEYVEVSVEACTARPTSTGCPGATTLLEDRSATSGESLDLGSQAATDQQWLLVRVTLPAETSKDAQALAGTLRLHARGVGEDLSVSPDEGPGGTTSGGEENGTGGTDEPGALAAGPDESAAGPGSSTSGSDWDTANGSGTSPDRPSEGSTGSGRSTGGSDESAARSAETTSAGQLVPGFLAATGMAVAVWLLAAAALLLLGEALRRGRRALTKNDEHEGDNRP